MESKDYDPVMGLARDSIPHARPWLGVKEMPRTLPASRYPMMRT